MRFCEQLYEQFQKRSVNSKHETLIMWSLSSFSAFTERKMIYGAYNYDRRNSFTDSKRAFR